MTVVLELILQIMSKVPTIFYFDDELLVDDEGKPRYVGGKRIDNKKSL